MKNFSHFCLTIIFVLMIAKVHAQSPVDRAKDSTLIKQYKLDFAVPDIPASKVLNVEKSKLLRPTTNEIVSFITSGNFDFTNLSIPMSFAAEISPLLLWNQNTTIRNYKTFTYNFRVSIATTRDDLEKSKLAFGIRTTLFDEGDPITDNVFLANVGNILKANELNKDALRKDYEEKHPEFKADDSGEIAKREKYVKDMQGSENNDKLKKLKNDYTEENWNKLKVDVATAFLYETEDTIVTKAKFTENSTWATLGFPFCKDCDWAQMFMGLNFNAKVNEKPVYAIISRIYAGINKAKGFLEVQYKNGGQIENNMFFNLGAELNLFANIWATYYAGIDYNLGDTKSSNFDSHFDLRYGLP